MTPGPSQEQIQLALIKQNKTTILRRMEMTQKCVDVGKKLQQAYGGEDVPPCPTCGHVAYEHLDANGILAYTILNMQLLQLELSITEGTEQLAQMDAAIRQLESPLSRARMVPPSGIIGR